MTIAQMMIEHSGLFYPGQMLSPWFNGEAFMDTPLPENSPTEMPFRRGYVGMPPEMILWHMTQALPAVVLVNLYVLFPKDPLWHGYFWTSDKDQYGQRVFVGSNGRGLEIHRHLHISSRWGVPEWK